jgi:2-amino-4-hydroxy-6-hydroxymethyldihydropteridine diphosphokinase
MRNLQRMSKVFVALGSNLSGNLESPASQVIQGFQSINGLPKTKLIKTSSLYQSVPFGYDAVQSSAQPDFINAVAEISTQLAPEKLLEALLKIELEAGRERPFANAPRVLDLDLLLYDDLILHTKNLTLPHPRMHERGFVLLPLAEIAPDLVIPNGGNVVKLALAHQNQGIKKLA